MRVIRVLNLADDDETFFEESFTTEEAACFAHAASIGDPECRGLERYLRETIEGSRTVACGDWVAFKELVTICV